MAKESISRFKSKIDETLELLRESRAKILSGKGDITSVLRTCYTSCQLIGREEEFGWLGYELNDYPSDTKLPSYRRLWGSYLSRFGIRIKVPVDREYADYRDSLFQAESHLRKGGINFVIDSGKAHEIERLTGWLPDQHIIPESSLVSMLNGVTNRLLELVNSLISELEYGGIPSSVFEEIRAQVDEKLVTTSPDATNKLKIAYEKLAGASSEEDWSQVALECRRIMKDVADAVFPPRNEPHIDKSGESRDVKADDYINRLLAFVDGHGEGGERKFIMAETEHLGSLLEQVYGLASKGVHDKVSKLDACRCMVYTYLLLGDILLFKS